MGTNYYWNPTSSPCPTCGHDPGEEIHIGKSSAGWAFALHVTDTITDLAAWELHWQLGTISNEYGDPLSPEEMLSQITERHNRNGLRRAAPEHCVSHGPGTWDLVSGEFS